MHVQRTNPMGTQCMYKGMYRGMYKGKPIMGKRCMYMGPFLRGKQCTYKGMYKVDQSYEDMTMHVQYKGMYKGPILWGQEACTKV